MSVNSRIEWCDTSWNPISGCTAVSEGCRFCFAAAFAARGLTPKYAGLTRRIDGRAVFNGTVRLHEDLLDMPLHWKKPRRIFVNSMSDLFHPDVPFEFVDKVFGVAALCPQHRFLILTKRPELMATYFVDIDYPKHIDYEKCRIVSRMPDQERPVDEYARPLGNVWFGTSCETQQTADERIPHLLRVPGIKFLSLEPLLEPIKELRLRDGVGWVIVGSESGPHCRVCHNFWVRDILEQCRNAHVPCFIKQLQIHGRVSHDMSEWPVDLRVREFPRERR